MAGSTISMVSTSWEMTPAKSASRLAITQANFLPTSDFTLTFPSVPSITYRVETGGILQATDATAPKPAKRFYRLRVIP